MSKTRDFQFQDGQGFWVFGYGSLMWDPGFDFAEKRTGLLRGYHRSFCLYSHRYRGTPEQPGLVLGLDRGGCCRGIVYRVAPKKARQTWDYLWHREMDQYSYQARHVHIATDKGTVDAVAYVVRRDHKQYAGKLSPDETLKCVVQGRGGRGTCFDYLANTVRHLDELGLPDGPLHDLLRLAQEKSGESLLKP